MKNGQDMRSACMRVAYTRCYTCQMQDNLSSSRNVGLSRKSYILTLADFEGLTETLLMIMPS